MWYCYATELHVCDFVIKDFIIKRGVICARLCIWSPWTGKTNEEIRKIYLGAKWKFDRKAHEKLSAVVEMTYTCLRYTKVYISIKISQIEFLRPMNFILLKQYFNMTAKKETSKYLGVNFQRCSRLFKQMYQTVLKNISENIDHIHE